MTWHHSDWHRWEPHAHAPGTALEDGYRGDWPGYFKAIEIADPPIVALGVTDYLSTNCYEEFLRQQAERESLELLVFPNIEFRLTPFTTRGNAINAHLLVSPEEPNHIQAIKDALTRLSTPIKKSRIPCTRDGLIALGKIHSGAELNDDDAYRVGVGQFKVDASVFLSWLEGEHWLRSNSLLVMSGGKDGLAGLRRDSGFRQYHDELVRAADMLFSSQLTDREYYAGRGTESARTIEEWYGSLKPCIHGSDGHDLERFLKPDLNRFCWIKAAPTFDGLRQTLFEPWERTQIAEALAEPPDPERIIASITLSNHAGWFATPSVPLSPYMTAIIGEKGTGKTALADVVAAATAAWEPVQGSFLAKAGAHLRTMDIELRWASGHVSALQVKDALAQDAGSEIRYLSQQFVERLCSGDILAEELVTEVERVVFDHIPDADRLNSVDFDDLRRKKTEALAAERLEIRQELGSLNESIERAQLQRAGLPKMREALKARVAEVDRLKRHLDTLISTKAAAASEAMGKLRTRLEEANAKAGKLKEQIVKTDGLKSKVLRAETSFETWFDQAKQELLLAGIPTDTWQEFKPRFTGSPLEPLRSHRDLLERQHHALTGSDSDPDGADTIYRLEAALKGEERKLQLDEARKRRVMSTQRALSKATTSVRQLQDEIETIERIEKEELPKARQRRNVEYLRYFHLLKQERSALEELYQPLRRELAARATGERDLDFEVVTKVDVRQWAGVGEDMLDLRRSGRYTNRGALEEAARASLEKEWAEANDEAISQGIHEIADGIIEGGLQEKLRDGYTPRHIADWLYSVDHIRLEYGLKYRGVGLKYLSPGTRGIVLLILYLAVDILDDRPLLIDQPEENLDNASVYEVLVKYFREAKKRRQIIIITHNPNLVVNTDAEEVVVTTSVRRENGLPVIKYAFGPLEHVHRLALDAPVKEQVCEILEGGRDAFRSRQRRYT